MKKVIVIGGGASGLIAAGRAAEQGHNVLLFDKNEKLGKKLYITGKGRCNITNESSIDVLVDNTCGNPHFMYSAYYQFDSYAAISFFRGLGLKTKTERGNRVFPESDKASDVVKTLEKYCIQNHVNVILNCGIKEILIKNGKVTGVIKQNNQIEKADCVIVATGGLSYPATGSDGDGYKFARKAGHTVSKLNPSLVPLKIKEKWGERLQGLSLKNVAIRVYEGKKKLYEDFGEMLFTHYGVSGPIVLSASRYLLGKYDKGCILSIDLKPALTEKELDLRIMRDFSKYINRDLRNSLYDLLPQKLIPVIIELSGVDPTKKGNNILKSERQALLKIIKSLDVTIIGTTGFKEAVITAGGVCVDEIDPSTMQSKLIEGLSFAGEVLDVDAYTGGFNLQIAFSTGYTAGSNI